MSKPLILALLLLCLTAPFATAHIDYVVAPDTIPSGELFRAWIIGGVPDSCWHFDTFTVRQETRVAIVDINFNYENPTGGLCVDPTDYWELYADFTFTDPGTWTLRVVEHWDHPDIPDTIWEEEFTVTEPTAAEAKSFGALKAIYR